MGLRATGGAIAQDLAKLHAIAASAAELNLLVGKTSLGPKMAYGTAGTLSAGGTISINISSYGFATIIAAFAIPITSAIDGVYISSVNTTNLIVGSTLGSGANIYWLVVGT